MARILALDVGTTAVKAAIVDLAAGARIVAIAESPLALATPAPGWAEQDPADWWQATRIAVAALEGDDVRVGGRLDVAAVAVTGQMQDLIALDAELAPVRAAILYSDVRADAEHRVLVDELGPAWTAAVGSAPDATNVAAKWRWLVAHEPHTVEATEVVAVGAHSVVVAHLTGIVRTDPTTAATTGYFDLRAGDWWAPSVTATGCPLAPVHAVREPVGPVTTDAAATLGLAEGVPVVLAPGDAVATTVGVLGDAVGAAYAYLGTSGWVAATAAAPRPAPGVIVLPGLGDEHWIHVAPMATACGALDWARAVLFGGIDHAGFDALAASADRPAAADGVVFLPHLDGVRTPDDAPDATGVLVGVRRATERATVAAAVQEGLAHAVRTLVELIAPDADPLRVCGGGSMSRQLCRTIADVTGVPVVALDSAHAAVVGAAVTAGPAIGAAADPTTTDAEVALPDAARRRAHLAIESSFADIVPNMRGLFHSLARARGGEAPTRRDP